MRSGLIVEILRSSYIGDCTNGGVTSAGRGAEKALLVLEEGGPFDEAWAERAGAPVLEVVTRNIGGEPYHHAQPVGPVPEGHAGWMAGGNFVYTSDSRFPNRYPLSVHDRSETWDAYYSNLD